jgi:hypothetical protein
MALCLISFARREWVNEPWVDETCFVILIGKKEPLFFSSLAKVLRQ